MAKSGYGVKEARIRTPREQVNLCGACGKEISATELLCPPCRGTMGSLVEPDLLGAPSSVGERVTRW